MESTPDFKRLPLRERKHARTKLGLLDAAVRALDDRSFAGVPVSELCDAVPISEASFFKYFQRKADVLVYYVQLWSLEMAWHSRRRSAATGGLAGIEDIFARTGRRIAEHPGVMVEIIAEQVQMTGAPDIPEVTLAERLLAFPDLPGIEAEAAMGVDALLPPLLDRAVEAGELPSETDRAGVLDALFGIFFGVPAVHRRARAGDVGAAYRKQLAWLWSGLRVNP
jgi:AcrR family transcriptional regulator